jgi:hypothetical protein
VNKLFHRTLGREPQTIADYNTLWTPGTTAGSFGRGDIAWPIHGPNWTVFGVNDMFQMTGPGTTEAFFIRNGLILLQEGGTMYYLNSAFPPDRSAIRRVGNPFSWIWPSTGCALPDGDSVVIFGYAYVHDAGLDQYTYRGSDVAIVTGLTGSSPVCTHGQTANLDNTAGINWTGTSFRDGAHLYIYGTNNGGFQNFVARCTWGNSISNFTSWQYWTGAGWSSLIADRAPVTYTGPAILEAMRVIRWRRGFLGSCKQLSSAPELGYPETPEIFQYYSTSPTGPWTYLGNGYDDTRYPSYFSYAAGMVALRGIPEPVAQWSLNGGSPFSINIYGPHWGTARPPVLPTKVLEPRIYIP